MLTRLEIKNFKRLENISFRLSPSVAIIGPNNSGKSTVFQALCLWEIGVRNYIDACNRNDLNRIGTVTINRKDLLNSPISDARFLWKNKKVAHTPITISLEGEHNGLSWTCATEFTFSNAESFSCKVVSGVTEMTEMYESGAGVHFGFLQAMSGISSSEDKLTQGSIDRKLGEGKTAEVLRNICFEILHPEVQSSVPVDTEKNWNRLCEIIKSMFGATLERPEYNRTTGLITLEYSENGIKYDISLAGRGFQQTLLLFAYMFANPNTILLLDEPDAHLEVIRQKEAYQQINAVADETNTQVIIASHSEVVLNEAANDAEVIALIENKAIELNSATKSQSIGYIRKSLIEIGWDKYYLAKSKGHVLYMEGSTDREMLLTFANKLRHRVEPLLRAANVQYTSDNVPFTAINNFTSLQAIFGELKGLALFDNIPNLQPNPKLTIICWQRRELENYFARPALLIKHAGLLCNKYPSYSSEELKTKMELAIKLYTIPAYLDNLEDSWWNDAKLSDEWLDKIFPAFFQSLNIPTGSNYKRDYYQLIRLMDKDDIPNEVSEKLDAIYEVLKSC